MFLFIKENTKRHQRCLTLCTVLRRRIYHLDDMNATYLIAKSMQDAARVLELHADILSECSTVLKHVRQQERSLNDVNEQLLDYATPQDADVELDEYLRTLDNATQHTEHTQRLSKTVSSFNNASLAPKALTTEAPSAAKNVPSQHTQSRPSHNITRTYDPTVEALLCE